MSVESFLEKQLQKFTIVDLGFVKSVYFTVGLLVFSLYPTLSALSAWFYFVLFVMCAFPLEVHLFSQSGNLIEKAHAYLQSNNPSNQVLLFLSLFFFALFLGTVFPILVSASWWVYVIIMIPLMIKPLTKTWFW